MGSTPCEVRNTENGPHPHPNPPLEGEGTSFTSFTILRYNGGNSTPICSRIPRGAPPGTTSGWITVILSPTTR